MAYAALSSRFDLRLADQAFFCLTKISILASASAKSVDCFLSFHTRLLSVSKLLLPNSRRKRGTNQFLLRLSHKDRLVWTQSSRTATHLKQTRCTGKAQRGLGRGEDIICDSEIVWNETGTRAELHRTSFAAPGVIRLSRKK
jgi:hypothetical protein